MNMITLIVALPLLAAFLLPIGDRAMSSLSRFIGPIVLLINILLILNLWQEAGGAPVALALGGFRPPLGISFYVDQLALLFALLVSILSLILWPYKGDTNPRVFGLMLLLAGAASGMALSGDLFNIYVFFELLSVASFGLVASQRTGAAFAATTRYLIISGFGTVMALTGIALIYTQTGTLNLAHLAAIAPQQLDNATGLTAFALILLGIGVKAELFPVNTWVPEVYATATRRVSALMAGLVSKLAVLVIVRLMVLIFPQPEAMQLMLVLGLVGVLIGELSAWRARDFVRMLSFSSIGQLGLVFVAFSIPGEAGVLAGLAVALHHLLVKPALFLLAERWGGALSRLGGAGRRSPLAAGLFVLFALSLVGVPPLPGFWAKLLTIVGLVGQAEPLYWFAAAVVLVATVVEVNYLFRFGLVLFKDKEASTQAHQPHGGLDLVTASVMGVVLLITMFLIAPLGDQLQTISQQATDRGLYISTVLGPVGGAR
jgi:formate hydrogenlyase subunit 3/multisubunit Na+/H+ antiporter MnhD subunit